MGETGCGKTRLLKYMNTVNVHGSYDMSDLECEAHGAVICF